MLNLKHIEQDIESVVAGADPDAIDMLAEHCQTLINEVERLRESSPEHVTEEILCMFETAFGETVPEGATQWGYTKHACAEVERLRGELEQARAAEREQCIEVVRYAPVESAVHVRDELALAIEHLKYRP
jgi:hypothetical protein